MACIRVVIIRQLIELNNSMITDRIQLSSQVLEQSNVDFDKFIKDDKSLISRAILTFKLFIVLNPPRNRDLLKPGYTKTIELFF